MSLSLLVGVFFPSRVNITAGLPTEGRQPWQSLLASASSRPHTACSPSGSRAQLS